MRNRTSALAYIVGVVGSLLVVALLVKAMQRYNQPTPVNQARVEERRKALADIHQAEAKGLNEYGWVDQGKGIVSLPIARAKELTLQDYKNPEAARKTMITRADKANFVPPKAPEKPSQYE
ncbi:MAG: hypothetical protein JWM16_1645 [Verrucomicrobiales bacterium]|nr:hypothetical protein [Verrucomicrobiales bacterium]